LFNQPFITPQDLAKENCVMLEPRRFPNGYRHMRNSWVEAGFEPKRVIKVHTFEDIFLTLESENAISIMPSFIKRFVSKDIQSAPIHTEKPLLMDLCGFYLKDETNPMIQNFMNELKHYIEEKMEQ
jgi:DNA-binding transcriptional LysR family regulator